MGGRPTATCCSQFSYALSDGDRPDAARLPFAPAACPTHGSLRSTAGVTPRTWSIQVRGAGVLTVQPRNPHRHCSKLPPPPLSPTRSRARRRGRLPSGLVRESGLSPVGTAGTGERPEVAQPTGLAACLREPVPAHMLRARPGFASPPSLSSSPGPSVLTQLAPPRPQFIRAAGSYHDGEPPWPMRVGAHWGISEIEF